MPLEPANHLDADVPRNRRDLARAVIELARVLGWQVYSLTELRHAPAPKERGSVARPGSVLLLTHPDQDRVLLVRLDGSGRRSGSARGSHAVGRTDHGRPGSTRVASLLEAHVWGSREILDGDVATCLLGAVKKVDRAA